MKKFFVYPVDFFLKEKMKFFHGSGKETFVFVCVQRLQFVENDVFSKGCL
jgi:hypothetical protein